MRTIRFIILLMCIGFNLHLKAQGNDRRPFTRNEVQFLNHKIDSIRKNLNRMIIYEKELKQRNYFLNEKTGLVDELIQTITYLKQSADVVAIKKVDVRKIFGKPKAAIPPRLIYEIETYKSNCPFMEITFTMKDDLVQKVDYRITDCQKWK